MKKQAKTRHELDSQGGREKWKDRCERYKNMFKIVRIQSHNNFVCFRWLSEKARNTSRAGQDQGSCAGEKLVRSKITIDHILDAKRKNGVEVVVGIHWLIFIKNDIYLIY